MGWGRLRRYVSVGIIAPIFGATDLSAQPAAARTPQASPADFTTTAKTEPLDFVGPFLEQYIYQIILRGGGGRLSDTRLMDGVFLTHAARGRITVNELKERIVRDAENSPEIIRRTATDFTAGRFLAVAETLDTLTTRLDSTPPTAEAVFWLPLRQGQLFYLGGDLASAIQALEKAQKFAPKEATLLRWMIQLNLGVVTHHWASQSSGADAARLLARSVEEHRAALDLSAGLKPTSSTITHLSLANVLARQARAAQQRGEEARLLQQALDAYRKSLSDREVAETADAQTAFGDALLNLADLSRATDRASLGKEAAQVFRTVLALRNRDASPTLWARSQTQLGRALDYQAVGEPPSEQAPLLAQQVEAHRASLTVYTLDPTRKDLAAFAYFRLGDALGEQTAMTRGAERVRLAKEAVVSYRSALNGLTRESTPREWAMLQTNFARALRYQAAGAAGEERGRIALEVEEAYHAAETVFTRETSPARWAGLQLSLGQFFQEQFASAQNQLASLEEKAAAAYRAALTIYTRETSPADWADAKAQLGSVLKGPIARAQGAEKIRLIEEALEVLHAALTVRTKEAQPPGWVTLQQDLAIVWREQAPLLGETATQTFEKAISAIRAGQAVWSQKENPLGWAALQTQLSATYEKWAGHAQPQAAALLMQAEEAYRQAQPILSAFPFRNSTSGAHPTLSRILKARAALAEGEERIRLLREAEAALQPTAATAPPSP